MTYTTDKLNIETPDHVDLEFQLAGPGARFLAYALDICVQAAILFGAVSLALGVWFLLEIVLELFPNLSKTTVDKALSYGGLWLMGFLVFLYGVVTLGYFAIFEYIDHGRTPGKKWINIRVMRSDGLPLAAWNVIIRNVLRMIDIFMCCSPVGVIFMLLDRHNRRLGDMAGGTVVIYDRGARRPPSNGSEHVPQRTSPEFKAAVARMTPATYTIMVKFLERTNELDPEKRKSIAINLYEKTLGRAPQDPEDVPGIITDLKDMVALYREKTRVL